jgi:hypothetical protein
VKASIVAGTFDARGDRHLSWTPLVLTGEGRERLIAAVDAFFVSLFDEQEDAKLRMARSGERPITATVGLAAFDSPPRRPFRPGLALPDSQPSTEGSPPYPPFYPRIAKLFRNPLNLTIVGELNLRAKTAIPWK